MGDRHVWSASILDTVQLVTAATVEDVTIMCDSEGRLYCGRCDATLVEKIEAGYVIKSDVWLQHYLDEHSTKVAS